MLGQGTLPFKVTGFDVTVPEGVEIKWQGRAMNSGPLRISLGAPGSKGVINYDTGKVDVEFRVAIQFPELSEILSDMGSDPGFSVPADAVIRSSGSVFDDHSLRLMGEAFVNDHKLLNSAETRIRIRAPSQ